MLRVKPLRWYKPTGHPQDNDDCILMARGFGGRYAISREQSHGPRYLLWLAGDEFIWVGCSSVNDAKAKAQADFEEHIKSKVEVE